MLVNPVREVGKRGQASIHLQCEDQDAESDRVIRPRHTWMTSRKVRQVAVTSRGLFTKEDQR